MPSHDAAEAGARRPITSTYRLQLRPEFTFAEAEAVVPYLRDLGVSHLYLSPILTATKGSAHGYDVTDPTTVREELGGRAGFIALARTARKAGLGVVVDIVPNHVGVEVAHENPWWWDVLAKGKDSARATFFDIDWDEFGRFDLPVLGSADDVAKLEVHDGELRYYDKRYPIAQGTGEGTAQEVHDRQHYRLAPWDTDRVGYRRFFDVSGLAALRQEDPAVFEASHAQIKSLVDEGFIDGLRVDHPDGLSDPISYLAGLRELIGPDRWLIIEKILHLGEGIDPALPVDGTVGYDALREIGGVFVDPDGEGPMSSLVERVTGSREDAKALATLGFECKHHVATKALRSELRRVSGRVVDVVGVARFEQHAPARVELAVSLVAAALPVYRADYPTLAGELQNTIADVAVRYLEVEAALASLAEALAVSPEIVARFFQFTAPVMAKGIEDRLFYRIARLTSLQEVGGDPGRFAVSAAEFHLAMANRAKFWPRTMTTLSTHDTKRGEDVRARLALLSEAADQWGRQVDEWEALCPSPEKFTGYFLWQTLFGVLPAAAPLPSDLGPRIAAYATKAIREASLHTSWNNPQQEYESAVLDWLSAVLDGPAASRIQAFRAELADHERANVLGQKLVQLTCPGIPDVYQGTEFPEDSLVDPDNRRLVDYPARISALAEGRNEKQQLVQAALRLRAERPESFVGGGYWPISGEGDENWRLLAFGRGPANGKPDVITLVSRLSASPLANGWEGTAVDLGSGAWENRLDGSSWTGAVPLASLFAERTVALLAEIKP